MFTLFICLMTSQTNFMFSFREEKDPKDILDIISASKEADSQHGVIKIKDDFGHQGIFPVSDISACMVTDYAKELKSELEKKIMGTRTNAELQQRLQADPVLKLHAANAAAVHGVQQ